MTPDIDWKVDSSIRPVDFASFSHILGRAHQGWKFSSVNSATSSQQDTGAYVRKYNLGKSYLTDVLALPMSGSKGLRNLGIEYLVISYIIYGDGYDIFTGNTRFTVRRGNIFVWNTSQAMEFESLEPIRQLSLFIPLDYPTKLDQLISNSCVNILDKSEAISNVLRSTLLALRKNAHNTTFSDEPFLVNPILELTKASVIKNNSLTQQKCRSQIQLLRDIRKYVKENLFDSDLNVAAISQTLGVSKRYIHRIFSREEISLSRWISNQRLEQAAKYLSDTEFNNISVTNIAFMTGFNDAAYFSKLFRRRYEKSPLEFRREASNSNPTAC